MEENTDKGSKTHYEVIIEIMTPMTVKYKIWAYDEKEAAIMVESGKVSPYYISKPKILKNNIKNMGVYLAGTVNRLFGYMR